MKKMNNRVFKLSECGIEAAAREVAAAFDLPGAVVLVPTETVYGLVCCADDPEAIRRIYFLKHRSEAKPLGWFIGDWHKLPEYGVQMEGLPAELAEKLRKRPEVQSVALEGKEKLRIILHPGTAPANFVAGLITEGVPVTGFEIARLHLEDIFLDATKGEVQ